MYTASTRAAYLALHQTPADSPTLDDAFWPTEAEAQAAVAASKARLAARKAREAEDAANAETAAAGSTDGRTFTWCKTARRFRDERGRFVARGVVDGSAPKADAFEALAQSFNPLDQETRRAAQRRSAYLRYAA